MDSMLCHGRMTYTRIGVHFFSVSPHGTRRQDHVDPAQDPANPHRMWLILKPCSLRGMGTECPPCIQRNALLNWLYKQTRSWSIGKHSGKYMSPITSLTNGRGQRDGLHARRFSFSQPKASVPLAQLRWCARNRCQYSLWETVSYR